MIKKISIILFFALLMTSCGVTNKGNDTEIVVELPSQEEAEMIASTLLSGSAGEGGISASEPKVVFPFDTPNGPQIISFVPAIDSGIVKIFTFSAENGEWGVTKTDSALLFDETNLKFGGFQDTTATLYILDTLNPILTFSTLLSDGVNAEYDIFVYNTSTNILQKVGLVGKLLSNGSIEGSSNKLFIDTPLSAEMQWAFNRFDNNSKLIELAEEVIITNQAFEWWFEKNPKASTASKINFGGIPANSTLVQEYNKVKKKEKVGTFTVAMFDHRGYTVIVAKKSSGDYILAWAEPICKNKATDPLLNTIYFEKGSQLAMFYYHGKKTYKLHLNLANGSIYKS